VTLDGSTAASLWAAAGAVLPVFAPLLVLAAATGALFRRTRALALPFILAACCADLALGVSAAPLSEQLGAADLTLFTWSPLGLYGATFAARRSPEVAMLSLPALGLALTALALTGRRRRWFSALGEATLSERTGGRWFRGAVSIDDVFRQVAADLSTYYSRAYRATGDEDKPRRVTVQVRNRPERRVRTRTEVIERSKARERAAVLSDREKEVLAFVARGARNREIAEELEISEFTVKRHMQNILQKLDVPSRRAAAAFYVSAYRDEAVADGRSA
jgi:DNA-binding CsgD family transcriptional regulator